MTDQQIIEALIARSEIVTRQFFFKSCRPLFQSIIRNVFSYEVDYDELVNELYIHLMENDAYRLRQFEGRSSLFQWLKVTAIRYFIAKRDGMIDTGGEDTLFDSAVQKEGIDTEKAMTAKMDIERSTYNHKSIYATQCQNSIFYLGDSLTEPDDKRTLLGAIGCKVA